MSSDGRPIVELSHVWKRYRLGGRRKRVSHKRTLASELARAVERAGPKRSWEPEAHLWALADASFMVGAGEAVAIIGANGSGKSTTLKLISRITEPWSGRVVTRGRVASLIEIRSGIHPELTGRENVYLYGTILGLRRKEIRRNFDRIVEFAELERYIDTPIKRYSSGMEVRLGFSVAVHINPDILLVDEVLAVGDEAFQRRCLRRMDRDSRRRADADLRLPRPVRREAPVSANRLSGSRGHQGRRVHGGHGRVVPSRSRRA